MKLFLRSLAVEKNKMRGNKMQFPQFYTRGWQFFIHFTCLHSFPAVIKWKHSFAILILFFCCWFNLMLIVPKSTGASKHQLSVSNESKHKKVLNYFVSILWNEFQFQFPVKTQTSVHVWKFLCNENIFDAKKLVRRNVYWNRAETL